METVQDYPMQIENWVHLSQENFLGNLTNSFIYIFGMSSEALDDNDCIYLNIGIEKKITNITLNKTVFFAKTNCGFKIKNEFKKPAPEFFYTLIEKATHEFIKVFYLRAINSTLSSHVIVKPSYHQIKFDIESAIEMWDKEFHIRFPHPRPNWQENFMNLPTIPEPKKWTKGSFYTQEQLISWKLQKGEPISKNEEIVFTELSGYYSQLETELVKLNYSAFTTQDIENFKNYIFYALNYLTLITNELTIFSTYRTVINEDVSGKNESITNISHLKYPPIHIVKSINEYNRANTPNSNIFYSSSDVDTTLKELRPPKYKLITVGKWRPKDIQKMLISYPISHSENAININIGLRKANHYFENEIFNDSVVIKNYLRNFLKILGREFTKKVNHHYEYLFSAIFSEKILREHLNIIDSKNIKYDCIVFPSVGNDYKTENIALLPETLDKNFILSEVVQFEIEEADYDKSYLPHDPEEITLAKVKNIKKAAKIDNDNGKIEW